MIDFPLPWRKSVTLDAMSIRPDLFGDDLSSAVGTGTLLAHDLVPEGLPASSKGLAEQRMQRCSLHRRGAY
jgi:hypothetical protein